MSDPYASFTDNTGTSAPPTPGAGFKVIWGPNFGNNDSQHGVAADISYRVTALTALDFVSAAIRMTSLGLATTEAVSATVSTVLGPRFTEQINASITAPALVMALRALTCQAAMTGIVVFNYATAGTYTHTSPAGQTTVQASAWGGGGNGGTAGTTGGGGGGGGGAFARTNSLSVTAGTGYTVTVGGAIADSWYSTTGVAPTSTTNGVLAARGSSGAAGTTSQGAGGAGGTTAASIGDTKQAGGAGGGGGGVGTLNGGGGGGGAGNAATGGAGNSNGTAGAGGSVGGGAGGTGANGATPATAATAPGGGGGGASTLGARSGGADGLVRLVYFI